MSTTYTPQSPAFARLWIAADLFAALVTGVGAALARAGARPARPTREEAFLAAATDHADLERRERMLERHRDAVRGMLPYL